MDQWGHLVEIYKKPFIYEYAMLYGYTYAMLVWINGATTSIYFRQLLHIFVVFSLFKDTHAIIWAYFQFFFIIL
jgi:hypothetical protein